MVCPEAPSCPNLCHISHCIEGYPQALKDPAWSLSQAEAARHISTVFLICWALDSVCPVSQISVQEGCVQPIPPIALTGGNDDTVGGVPWAVRAAGASSKSLAQMALQAPCYSYRRKETGAVGEQLLQRVPPALLPSTLLSSSGQRHSSVAQPPSRGLAPRDLGRRAKGNPDSQPTTV